jgi:ABC-type sugar transport system ATPase subunit
LQIATSAPTIASISAEKQEYRGRWTRAARPRPRHGVPDARAVSAQDGHAERRVRAAHEADAGSGAGAARAPTLGIRPEHVGVTLGGNGDIALPVRLVEPLGRDTLLYFDAGTERAFVAVSEGLDMAEVKVGARMALSLDPRRLYLFDADGRRLVPS